MSIDVSWYDQKSHILLWKIGESWTLDDYYQAYEQTNIQLSVVDEPVYMIIDATAPIERPRIGMMSHLLKVLTDAELEMLIYVRQGTGPPIVPQFINLIMRTNRSIKIKQVKFMSSVADAVQYIWDSLSS